MVLTQCNHCDEVTVAFVPCYTDYINNEPVDLISCFVIFHNSDLCCLLVNVANSLDPDKAQQYVGPG